MNLRQHLTHCLICLAWLAGALILPACSIPAQNNTSRQHSITVGMDTSAAGTLIHVAASQGYFAARDLNVTIQYYPSGLAAMDAALNEEVDVAVASEFALVGKTFAGEPLQSWGSIDRFLHVYLVGRLGRGIETVSDLRGKTIGLPVKTAAEFYLGRYLDLHGLNLQEVPITNYSPADLPKALKDDAVDAVVVWPPFTRTIEDQVGSGSIFRWPVQNDQVGYANLVSSEAWIQAHREPVQRFLEALIEAEVFYAANPQAVRTILQKSLSYDDAFLNSVLSEHQFQVSLDQSMVLAMEDEARWMINKQVVTNTQTPDFLDRLYLDGLLAVRPDSVNIIR